LTKIPPHGINSTMPFVSSFGVLSYQAAEGGDGRKRRSSALQMF